MRTFIHRLSADRIDYRSAVDIINSDIYRLRIRQITIVGYESDSKQTTLREIRIERE